MTQDVAADEPDAGSDGDAESSVESRERPAARRSIWRVSLGGILLFAAGAMVGFAPMRAWLFFKDEPKQVLIEGILFEVREFENEAVRQAFAAGESSDLARGIHPLAILASRARTHRVVSQPTLTTVVDEPVLLSYGMSTTMVATGAGSFAFVPTDGVHMSFLSTVRHSGKLQLEIETTYLSSLSGGASSPLTNGVEEATIGSTVVADADEWRLIDMNLPTEENAAAQRTRWLVVRMKPMTR